MFWLPLWQKMAKSKQQKLQYFQIQDVDVVSKPNRMRYTGHLEGTAEELWWGKKKGVSILDLSEKLLSLPAFRSHRCTAFTELQVVLTQTQSHYIGGGHQSGWDGFGPPIFCWLTRDAGGNVS